MRFDHMSFSCQTSVNRLPQSAADFYTSLWGYGLVQAFKVVDGLLENCTEEAKGSANYQRALGLSSEILSGAAALLVPQNNVKPFA
jgi:hypothetical protein